MLTSSIICFFSYSYSSFQVFIVVVMLLSHTFIVLLHDLSKEDFAAILFFLYLVLL